MTKQQLLVYAPKNFKIAVPDDSRITFGPWSPPGPNADKYGNRDEGSKKGTLRIYGPGTKATESILGVFSGVTGFRDLTLEYSEEVAREEGAIIWKSDKDGYQREEKVSKSSDFVVPQIGTSAPAAKITKKSK